MANIFEELMLKSASLNESVKPARKTMNESKKIKINKIKLESRRIFEEESFDELDAQFDVDPNENTDEVVLVIDPDIPAEDEVPEDAAEELVGDYVYKCPVCGSNYVCDCDAEMNESVEVDENGVPVECPICGDDADQILIGEITPAEEVDPEDEKEMDPVDVDDIPEEEIETETEVVEENSKRRPLRRRVKEDLDYPEDDEIGEIEDVVELELVPEICEDCEDSEREEETPDVEIKNAEVVNIVLDETPLEEMLKNVIRENYKNKADVKIIRASTRGKSLRVEYVVRSGRKSKKGILVAEGFSRNSRKMTLRFRDKGAFTESFSKTPSFVVECIKIKNVIRPIRMSYDYKLKINESVYRVYGKVGK